MGPFEKYSGLLESAFRCYIFYSEEKGKRDLLEEIRYLQEALRAEREHNSFLKTESASFQNKADQFWALLNAEGYFFNEKGELMKRELFTEEDDEEEEEDSEEEDSVISN
jgi:hypothetical protein